jgi:hypothetical protein
MSQPLTAKRPLTFVVAMFIWDSRCLAETWRRIVQMGVYMSSILTDYTSRCLAHRFENSLTH